VKVDRFPIRSTIKERRKMRTKIKAIFVAVACAAAIGAAAPVKAASLGHGILAGTLDLAKIGAPAVADSEGFQVWNVGHRHRRRHRHHRHHDRWGWLGFAPLWGLALSQSLNSPPPPPPAPAWRFDGYRWVCDYVDGAGRPLCR